MNYLLFLFSTGLSFFAAQSSVLGTMFTKWNNSPTSEERVLLKEKQKLKSQQRQYSMMDEFAKYSKIQRKINAIDEQLKESSDSKNSVMGQVISIYGPQILCSVILLMLTIYYRRTPLFKFPDYIDLTPFNYIISYPNERNYVSFHFWIMSCNVVARTIKF